MHHQWAVIGAGPAGIAAIGKLIDFGIAGDDIIWVDPAFTVGDFGTIWRNVPSNTRVRLFLKFLHASPAFNFKDCLHDLEIKHIHPDKTCHLHHMADPLQWITSHLKLKVNIVQDMAQQLILKNNAWQIEFKQFNVIAKNIILAIGALPKQLSGFSVPIIPLQDALDNQGIKKHLTPDDTIAVFGSSHSAILVLKNLVEAKVKHIINFYRSPLRYAIPIDDWILYDDTGLKGETADWAREYIDGQLPHNLIRVYSDNTHIEKVLQQKNIKVCYAIGFERRSLSIICDKFQARNGMIAPGLFGLGIAFPEAKYNPIGLLEYRVGLWKFMEYLEHILPVWLKWNAECHGRVD